MKQFLTLLAVGGLLVLATAAFAVNDTATSAFGTNVNEIAVLDIFGIAGDLTLVAPTTGGAAIAAVTSATTYAQYTSVIDTGKTRILDAKITAGTIAAGTTLKLTAGTPNVSGGGNLGTAASQVTVTDTAANIVTNIGSCATGTGGTAGVNLNYELSVSAIGSLIKTVANEITVTFTLNDGA